MVDGLIRSHHARSALGRFAGVQVAIEAREVTARDIEAELMAGFEDVARGPQIDGVFVDLPGRDRLSLCR